MESSTKKRAAPVTTVGMVGYGALGQYLVAAMEKMPERFKVVWIYNRSPVDHPLYVAEVSKGKTAPVDLVVEVAHPNVLKDLKILELGCDVFIGSPTCFAQFEKVEIPSNVACYVGVGALWGAADIQKMQDRDTLGGLTIQMEKHPEHLKKVNGYIREKLDVYMADETATGPLELYNGPVRGICSFAPNNVNTMACGAIVGLGFDQTTGVLIADKSLTGHHIVSVKLQGKNGFQVDTVRKNPAKLGAVTGQATFVSFFSSLLKAKGGEKGKMTVI
jgi:predicted dinucleotide-utilizing enzyme